ncbi:hypothetical protein [Dictyobacter kobayashii]|uniref:Heme-copper oxidase subunit III family profile domain-containing protein n=1 Tax=Dictyobacter kobayashii TaxID=2014872 RepID=A0A402ANT3_9CHLR|nr:hypothetical protein [Dictyobacter kobayashii]GCE20776.1 hypothetical protein KDK_45760 [Dictyobacter kobayashii]
MNTALEQMHEIEPRVRVVRARAAVLLLILSDALSIVAIMAAGGYLSALDTLNQYRLSGEHPPAFLPGLLLIIGLLLSGLSYYWWERSVRKDDGSGQQVFFYLALVLMVLGLVGQIWIGATLGYAAPFHAYVSLMLLFTWYAAAHLLLTVIVGALMLGRLLRGRVAGYSYLVTSVGYWWYYTVIAALIMWLFASLLM